VTAMAAAARTIAMIAVVSTMAHCVMKRKQRTSIKSLITHGGRARIETAFTVLDHWTRTSNNQESTRPVSSRPQ
jgi:hypothetical protein